MISVGVKGIEIQTNVQSIVYGIIDSHYCEPLDLGPCVHASIHVPCSIPCTSGMAKGAPASAHQGKEVPGARASRASTAGTAMPGPWLCMLSKISRPWRDQWWKARTNEIGNQKRDSTINPLMGHAPLTETSAL